MLPEDLGTVETGSPPGVHQEVTNLFQSAQQEYLFLQTQFDDFDSKSLEIKKWAISVSLVGYGFAYSQEAPIILLLVSFSALLFWMLETYWKNFQRAYVKRIQEIEAFMRKEISESDFHPLQITQRWGEHYQTLGMRPFFYPSVALPHLFIIIAGIVLFCLHVNGVFPLGA